MGLYDTTLGTLLVGVLFNTFLYGLVTYQFAAYYRTKFDDRPATKYMVLFLFILDTFHSLSVMYMAWTYTVANFDNPVALEVAEWPYTFTPIGTALAALVTQLYLGFRIWCLTRSKILFGVIITLAIPSFVLGLCCSIEAWIIKVLSKLPRITSLVIAWLSMQVIVDIFITVTLIIIFTNSRTGFRKTDTVLNRLIRGAIQTGLFAGIFSMGDLITFVVLPSTNFYGMFAIPIGRIYTNTLMDTLLTRESLKAEMAGTYNMDTASDPPTVRTIAIHHGPLQSGQIDWAPTNSSQTNSTAQSSSFQLQVKKTEVLETIYDRQSDDVDGKIVPLVTAV